MLDYSTITKDDLDAQLNTVFKISSQEFDVIDFTLVEVEEKDTDQVYSLTLIFTGPADKHLPDNTYTVNHDEFGEFNMFLSAYKQEGDVIHYDVHFSRLKNN